MPGKARKMSRANGESLGFTHAVRQATLAQTAQDMAKEVKQVRAFLKAGQQSKNQPSMKSSRSVTAALVKEKVPHLPSNYSNALGQFADPLNYEPVRVPDITSVSSVGTASAVLSLVYNQSWPSTAPADADWPQAAAVLPLATPTAMVTDKADRLLVLTRDQVVFGIYMGGPFDTATPSVYTGIFTNLNNIAAFGAQTFFIKNQQPTPLALGTCGHSSGPTRWSGQIVPGSNAGKVLIWLDGTVARPTTVTLNGTVNASSGAALVGKSVSFLTYLHTGPDTTTEVGKLSVVIPALGAPWPATAIASITASGYYSFESILAEASTGNELVISFPTWTVTASAAYTYIHILHPDVMTTGLIEDQRLLGATMLCTNVTASFFKSGTVYAKQKNPGDPWYSQVQEPEDFTSVNTQLCYDGPLSKGLYAIAKPQGEGCLDMKPCIDISYGAGTLIPNFKPFDIPGTVVALLSPSDPYNANNHVEPTMTVHLVRGIEFTTQSQLVRVAKPQMHRTEFLDLMDGLGNLPQFYENPLHIKDIRAAIERAGGWTWRNRASIGALMAAFASRNPVAIAAALAKLSSVS